MEAWTAYLGTDFKEELLLKDEVDTVFDLTGYTVTADVRTKAGGIHKVSGSITIDPDPTTGQLDFELTDTQVDSVGSGNFVVDLLVVNDATGYKYRSEIASLEIKKVVTA